MIVRRERPHPGAQISVFEAHDGWRYQGLRHRHPGRAAGVPGGPAPRPRPGRGQHPHRQTDRAGPVPVPGVHDQRGLAAARVDRRRPDRLDPDHPARPERWPRPSRNCCATGCCTPPPGSPAAAGGPSSRSRPAGPGPTNSPPRSPASPTSDNRCWPDQPADPAHPPPRTRGEPDTRPAAPALPSGEDQQPSLPERCPTKIIPGLTKEGG